MKPEKQAKIRLIDKKRGRGKDITSILDKYNKFTETEARQIDIGTEGGNCPDIFLIHTKDLRKDGEPSYEYLTEIDRSLKKALIVLYSGGNIELIGKSEGRIEFIYEEKTWGFDVQDSSRFCIIKRPISTASDFKIVQALERYFISGQNKYVFFEALLHPAIEYLCALAVLCQGYLGASIAAGEITDQDTMKLIGWNPDIPDRFPDLAAQAQEVKKSSWWCALGEPAEFEENIRLEFIALNKDVKLKNFLQLILDQRGIKDYKSVKYCYEKIRKELGGEK